MGTIISVIKVIATLIDLIGWLKDTIGEAQLNSFLRDTEVAVEKLKKASTPEEKHEAAKSFVDLIARLP